MEQVISMSASSYGVLEVLGRGGKVVERLNIDGEAVTIGRSYSNDLVLDDAYVSPEHASLNLQGDYLLVKDLSSTNGISLNRFHIKGESASLESEQIFRVGHTKIRFRMADAELPETRLDRQLQTSFWSPQNPILMLIIGLILTGFVIMEAWFSQTEELEMTKLLAELVSSTIMIILWAGLWAIFGKIMTDRPSFLTHVCIFMIAMVAIYTSSELLSYTFFAFGFDDLYQHIFMLVIAAIVCWMLYKHLRYSTKKSNQTLLTSSIFLTLIGVGFYLLQNQILETEFDSRPQYSLLLKSPDYNLVLGDSVDQFFSETKSLQEDLSKALD